MAITRFGTRSIKGQSWFRGDPKSHLQIKPAVNTAAIVAWMSDVSPHGTPSYMQVLVNSECSHWLFQLHLSPLIRCALTAGNANVERDKRCRAVSDTFKPLASPCRSTAYLLQLHSNYPCWIATPNHTWFWDALPLSPLVSLSHCLVLIEHTDNTEGVRHTLMQIIHTLYIVLPFFFGFMM